MLIYIDHEHGEVEVSDAALCVDALAMSDDALIGEIVARWRYGNSSLDGIASVLRVEGHAVSADVIARAKQEASAILHEQAGAIYGGVR